MSTVADMTRQEVVDTLGSAMRGSSGRGPFEFQVRPGNARTFAIEVNHSEADPLARAERLAFDLGMSMEPTGDAALATIAGEQGGLFIDVADPRFWLLHTTGPASWLERLLARRVAHGTDIDWCWQAQSMIKTTQREGRTRWFQSDFRGEELLPSAGVAARRLKVQLEGEDAERLQEIIATAVGYESAAALTSVTVDLGEGDEGNLTAATHYRGAFLGRGDSFAMHQAFVGRVIDRYSEQVRAAEGQYALRWTLAEDSHGVALSGQPIEIRLTRSIADLDKFAANLFASRDPFRLWATPTRASDRVIEANAVDLHVGQVVRIDIYADRLLVYLADGVCANTVFRLLANLQHRFDSKATAIAGGTLLA